MADTVTEKLEKGTEPTIQDKTFTQDDMNALAGKIRAEEKAKYSDYEELKKKAARFDEIEEANKSDLQKANDKVDELQAKYDALIKDNETKTMREKVAKEMNVPVNVLTGDNEESCKAQAQAVLDFAGVNTNNVPDGGEVTPPGGKKSNAEVFADIFHEQFGK